MSGFRSGFVSIIGCPNVGKSTLLNAFVGQKISIVADKAQTTRNRITGVVSGEGYQTVFLDTPGITDPKNRLGEYMYKTAIDSLDSIEAVLYVADARQGIRDKDGRVLEKIRPSSTPKIAVVNKTDAVDASTAESVSKELESTGIFERVFLVSALNGTGLEEVLEALKQHLPEGPQYFPDDMITDQPERIICAELIREKTLRLLKDEVPHGIGVNIDKMEMREDRPLMDIYATIYCERESHKRIIIGKQGSMLRKIGAEARADMETMLDCRVNLQLWVKFKEDWRNKPAVLHELGYE